MTASSTPLNSILGFQPSCCSASKEAPLTEKRHRSPRTRAARRRGTYWELIDDILDPVGASEAGRVLISNEPVDIHGGLNEVKATLDPMATRAGIRLTLAALPEHLPQVVADRTRFARILINFGSNALQCGKPSGKRGVLRRAHSATASHASMTDDGIGIPLNRRIKIFQPFPPRRPGNGTDVQGHGHRARDHAPARRADGSLRVAFEKHPQAGVRDSGSISRSRRA